MRSAIQSLKDERMTCGTTAFPVLWSKNPFPPVFLITLVDALYAFRNGRVRHDTSPWSTKNKFISRMPRYDVEKSDSLISQCNVMYLSRLHMFRRHIPKAFCKVNFAPYCEPNFLTSASRRFLQIRAVSPPTKGLTTTPHQNGILKWTSLRSSLNG